MANITQNANKQSVKYPHTPTKCVANNPLGVGADSSCPYPDINKKRVSVSLNTHIHIIKYTHSFHHTRIFFPHFVGVFIYAGTINRPLRLLVVCHYAANGLPKRCEHQRNTHETPTKWGANTPKTPTKHSVRRRGRFIVPVS